MRRRQPIFQKRPLAVAIELTKAIAPDLEKEIRGNFVLIPGLRKIIRPPPVYDSNWHETNV